MSWVLPHEDWPWHTHMLLYTHLVHQWRPVCRGYKQLQPVLHHCTSTLHCSLTLSHVTLTPSWTRNHTVDPVPIWTLTLTWWGSEVSPSMDWPLKTVCRLHCECQSCHRTPLHLHTFTPAHLHWKHTCSCAQGTNETFLRDSSTEYKCTDWLACMSDSSNYVTQWPIQKLSIGKYDGGSEVERGRGPRGDSGG